MYEAEDEQSSVQQICVYTTITFIVHKAGKVANKNLVV